MKYCIKCGNQIPDAADFCPKCGARQESLDESTPNNDAVTSEEIKEKRKPNKLLIAAIAIVCIVLVVAGIFLTRHESAVISPFSESPDAISAAAGSVIKLSCFDKNGELYCTGSAFALFEANTFVTNYHVIQDDVYSITGENEAGLSFPINKVIAYDEDKDIAILKSNVETGIPVLTYGDSDAILKGSNVIAIGSPLGLKNTISSGVFSNIIEEDGNGYLEFSASISSGSSGGVLFNDSGEAVGITSASYIDGQNLNLAVPINQVVELWNSRSDEMAIEDFYMLFEHTQIYSVSELLKNPALHASEEFYLIGVIYRESSDSVYIVDSEEALNNILGYISTYIKIDENKVIDFSAWMKKREYLATRALDFMVPENFPSIYQTGDTVILKGKIYCFEPSSDSINTIYTHADDIAYYTGS